MSHSLVSRAAVVLVQIPTQAFPPSCSLEAIERLAHCRVHEVSRAAVEQFAQRVIAAAEAQPSPCPCGRSPVAVRRRRRELLVLSGPSRV